jgi:hypothetical protein
MNPIWKWTVVVCILASGTFAWGVEFGPPGPLGKQGKYSVAAGFASGREKMTGDGNPSIDRNLVYVEGTYHRPGTDWEGFLKLGAADARIENLSPSFSADYRFMSAAGVRGAFKTWNREKEHGPSIGLGGFAQVKDIYGDFKDGNRRLKNNQSTEFDVGLSVSLDFGPMIVYGGHVASWYRIDLASAGRKTPLREKNVLGGYAGVRIPFSGGMFVDVEGQYHGGGELAAAIGKSF